MKKLSVLVRSFSDVAAYTLGFPAPREAGQVDTFKLVRGILPGPVRAREREEGG